LSLITDIILSQADDICEQLGNLPIDERIAVLNELRRRLHAVSPFQSEPVDCVLWLPHEHVQGNDYNPNHVAPPEMRLLERSIAADGYTQPIVAHENGDGVEVVDGFHRSQVGKERPRIRERLHGYLPVTLINAQRSDRRDRMAATIRHNRARGKHAVVLMTDLVADLLRQGWTAEEVAQELGMDTDEVLRFMQQTGIADLFKGQRYSRAWE
jgi:ParB-like chromosome segregation protein Spo0J